jgi:CRP-like cAMP-binding protein
METRSDAPISATTLFLRRLEKNAPLTPGELATLRDIGWQVHSLRRRHTIVAQGMRRRAAYLIIDGFLMRYRTLRDGRRQVVNLLIPGDFAGVSSDLFVDARYSTKALTKATVAAVPFHRLVGLFENHPRLAAKIFWSLSCDTAIRAEHVVVVARKSAPERIAHFLLELLTRLQMVGLADERSYDMPLSQEAIGDVLGLSPAYVNRVLRRLTDDGMMTIKNQRVIINDVDELAALADFERDYLRPLSISDFADVNRSAPGAEQRLAS